jgi:hypothetical protein
MVEIGELGRLVTSVVGDSPWYRELSAFPLLDGKVEMAGVEAGMERFGVKGRRCGPVRACAG